VATAIDFAQLEAAKSSASVTLLEHQGLQTVPFTSDVFTGFAAVAGIELSLQVALRGTDSPSLELKVEGSADGLVWSTLSGCDFSFTADGAAEAKVQAPPDQLRVTATPGAGMQEGEIFYVRATPFFEGETPSLDAVLAAGDAAGNRQIAQLQDPDDPQDAATKAYVDAKFTTLLSALPTSDPHVAGQLWNNAGALTVSAG
jgi:hypothetical protein